MARKVGEPGGAELAGCTPHQMPHRHNQVQICINKINPEDEKELLKILFISFVKGASEYIVIPITVSTNLYEIKPTKTRCQV